MGLLRESTVPNLDPIAPRDMGTVNHKIYHRPVCNPFPFSCLPALLAQRQSLGVSAKSSCRWLALTSALYSPGIPHFAAHKV